MGISGTSPPSRTVATRWSRPVLLLIGVGSAVWAASRASASGASLTGALHLIARLPWLQVLGLAALWLLGLVVHTVVLAASMPGLTHRRALVLNLTGSAVSNVLPFGGVAGTALNLTMTRSWGFTDPEFARFVVVSKGADFAAKLLVPLAALGWLAASHAVPALWWALAAVAFAAGLTLIWALAGRTAPLLRLMRTAARPAAWVLRRRVGALEATWLAGSDRLVRQGRYRLLTGMTGYWLAQGALLWCCLLAVGVSPSAAVVFGALAAERVTTLLFLTPGGAGPAEAGMVTTLIALGADPTRSVAGVLLFRAFVFAAEIPVGAALLLCWWSVRRLRDRAAWRHRRDGTPPACA